MSAYSLFLYQGVKTYDALLRENERVLDELALGGEVEAVVEDLGPGVGDELVAEGADLAVHDKTLDIEMGVAELEGVSFGASQGGKG